MSGSTAGHLFVRIDPRAPEPLQTQIYASIRRAILEGVLAPGVRLPSSRALAADLGISRTTTVLAFDQLTAEGYLTARAGSGTFVTRELPDDRPRARAAGRGAAGQHPPMSRRGVALAATRASSLKIYVGSFSKTLFPALRLGFLIVPRDLHEAVLMARLATDIGPAGHDQAVLADFIAGGHFERHLRRMRTEYRARLDALADAAARYGRGALRVRPVATGLHAIADLEEADGERVFHEAMARGVEVMPLSAYCFDRRTPSANGLALGFGAVSPDLIDAGMTRLVAAIEAARRSVTESRRAIRRPAQRTTAAR